MRSIVSVLGEGFSRRDNLIDPSPFPHPSLRHTLSHLMDVVGEGKVYYNFIPLPKEREILTANQMPAIALQLL